MLPSSQNWHSTGSICKRKLLRRSRMSNNGCRPIVAIRNCRNLIIHYRPTGRRYRGNCARPVHESIEFGDLTDGAFDITVGPLVNLWGFGPDDARDEPPSIAAIDAAMSATGRQHLHADCRIPAIRKDHADLHIDLSAYAKGLAADNIAALLDKESITNYLIEIGGDLRARGRNASNAKWRIAIERPGQPGNAVEKIIHIQDLSVATSGDYRNFFEFEGRRYSHTIDPRTGWSVTHNLASRDRTRRKRRVCRRNGHCIDGAWSRGWNGVCRAGGHCGGSIAARWGLHHRTHEHRVHVSDKPLISGALTNVV